MPTTHHININAGQVIEALRYMGPLPSGSASIM